MDLLSRGSTFTDAQYTDFKYDPDELLAQQQPNGPNRNPPETWPGTMVINFCPTTEHPGYRKRQHSKEVDTAALWSERLTEVPTSDSQGPSASIILFPRSQSAVTRKLPKGLQYIPILKHLPVSQAIFKATVEKFHIHQALQIVINRGKSIICRLKPSQDRTTYILRSDHSLTRDLALSVTYFSDKKRLYAVFFGCRQEDMIWIQRRLTFAGKTTLATFTLISCFLELEKIQRFADVNCQDNRMYELIENFWDERDGSQANDWVHDDDPKDLVRRSRTITYLRNNLEQWKSEIAGLKSNASDFLANIPNPLDTGGPTIPLLDVSDYLVRLMNEYDEKIRTCDGILATAALAFQMETASNARKEAGKMRTVALLTMFFLPATFVSTLFAIGIFKWRPDPPSSSSTPGTGDSSPAADDSVVSPWLWKLYIPLVLALTAIVLGFYYCWTPLTRCCRFGRRHPRRHVTDRETV